MSGLSREVLLEYDIPKLTQLLEELERMHDSGGATTRHVPMLVADYNLVEEVLIEKGYYNIQPAMPEQPTPLIQQWQKDEGRWDSVCLDCGSHWASNIKICRPCELQRLQKK